MILGMLDLILQLVARAKSPGILPFGAGVIELAGLKSFM
jgi:hypothetical protein